jgi:GTP-binding protein
LTLVSFVDQVTLHVRAGNGGDGCVSVHREKFKPLGGPDGADGGKGGSISLISDPNVTTLLDFHFHPHRAAGDGGDGAGDYRNGHHGENLVLPVPVGTVVKNAKGVMIADLDEPGMELIIAEGGMGGLGNAALASTKRKAPGFALLGVPGWAGDIILELKTVADVALVGYPSAGKSSLIAALSAARPKIADYPFTTLHPNLGVVQAGDTRFTIADVPGLIEGASEGKGLGLQFLRHVERCSALLHVIDCATIEPNRDPVSDLDKILKELDAYQVPEGELPLTQRPQLIALNKADVPDGKELAEFVKPDLEARGYRVFIISAASHEGLRELNFALASLVEQARKDKQTAPAKPRIQLMQSKRDESKFEVKTEMYGDEQIFRVLGVKPERWVAQTQFGNEEAVGYLGDRLAKIGLEDALYKAGATAGSTVVIGPGKGVIFDWEPTINSAAELIAGPRGTDARLDMNDRRTTKQRRQTYTERMDAKAAAREELRKEGEAGIWSKPEDFEKED